MSSTQNDEIKTDQTLLREFQTCVNTLNATKGTNAKLEYLRQQTHLRDIFAMLWDPNTTTGITGDGLRKFLTTKYKRTAGRHYTPIMQLVELLTSRHLTGDEAKNVCWDTIERAGWDESSRELVIQILEKKPRIRMGSTLILEAFPGLFKTYKVALAKDYDEKTFQQNLKKYGRAWISPKYDGVRCQAHITKGGIKFYSREGNAFVSLKKVEEEINRCVLPILEPSELAYGIVFDMEVFSDNFKTTVSEIKKLDVPMRDPRCFVFDVVALPAFQKAAGERKFGDRLEDLRGLFEEAECKPPRLQVVEQVLWTPESWEAMKKRATEGGWEGLMIRFDAPYEGKRANTLMKFKEMHDDEFVVQSVIIEDMKFPNKNGGETTQRALKAVRIHLPGGDPVDVGSGFSTEERIEYAKHPETIVGKTIVVKYFEIFTDKQTGQKSLRFPIFKYIYDKKRDV